MAPCQVVLPMALTNDHRPQAGGVKDDDEIARVVNIEPAGFD